MPSLVHPALDDVEDRFGRDWSGIAFGAFLARRETTAPEVSNDELRSGPGDIEGRRFRQRCLDDALHSLRMSGTTLDPDTVPEFAALVDGTMTSDEAVASIFARHLRRSPSNEKPEELLVRTPARIAT